MLHSPIASVGPTVAADVVVEIAAVPEYKSPIVLHWKTSSISIQVAMSCGCGIVFLLLLFIIRVEIMLSPEL